MYKAISYAIFTGSNYLGCMSTGKFQQDMILENCDECLEGNSMHLHHNRPDLKIVKPKEWGIQGFFGLIKDDYDYLYSNPNCSGLSRINRCACADHPRNNSLLESFGIIDRIDPKTFFIENAPALCSNTGWPILCRMVRELGDRYRFNITRDFGKHHGVNMSRQRTLVTGYRRDVFDTNYLLPFDPITAGPVLQTCGGPQEPHDEGVFEYSRYVRELATIVDTHWDIFEHLVHKYEKTFATLSLMISTEVSNPYKRYEETYDWNELIAQCDISQKTKDTLKAEIGRKIKKLSMGKGFWDKSPVLITKDTQNAMSLTSLSVMYNFEERRLFNIREYANLMGYPKDFVFLPGVNVGHVAQGVPALFAKYVHEHIATVLDGGGEIVQETVSRPKADVVLQINGGKNRRWIWTTNEEFPLFEGINGHFNKEV